MAVAFRSASTASSVAGTGTTVSLTQPTGSVAGDIVIINCGTNATVAGSVFTATGFSTVPTFVPQTQGNTCSQYLLYRILDGTESWPITLTSTSTVRIIAAVGAWSGVDPNNPFAGVNSKLNAASTAASLTATSPLAESVYGVLFIRSRNVTATSTVTANSTGFTLEADACTTSTSFNQAAILDQHTLYTLPIAVPTIANSTLSQSSNQVNTVVFLRADLSTATTLATDVTTGITANASATATVVSPTFSTGYAETLRALLSISSSTTVSSVTDTTGLTWASRGSVADGSGNTLALYTAQSTGAISSTAVTVTASGTATVKVQVTSYINSIAPGTNPIGATNSATGSSAAYTASLTTTANNSQVEGAALNGSGNAFTAGASQDTFQKNTTNFIATIGQRRNALTPTSGTSVAISGTLTSSTWAELVYEVLPRVTSTTAITFITYRPPWRS